LFGLFYPPFDPIFLSEDQNFPRRPELAEIIWLYFGHLKPFLDLRQPLLKIKEK
jgi:hypothetical protein